MARSKDPLTAATTSILQPGLESAGFAKLTARVFVRLRSPIVQHVSVSLSRWGGNRFSVCYSSMPLFVPATDFTLMVGGWFPRDGHENGEWSKKHHDAADHAMNSVLDEFQTGILPWFDRTDTVDAIIPILTSMAYTPKGPRELELGACHAWLGNVDAAKAVLSFDGGNHVARELCESLLTAIETGTHQSHLDGWQSNTVQSLELGKLTSA